MSDDGLRVNRYQVGYVNGARKARAEFEDIVAKLEERVAQARTLILAAPLHMPTWPENQARNDWVRSSQIWLNADEQ